MNNIAAAPPLAPVPRAPSTITFTDSERRIFRRRERLTVSEWTTRYRVVIDGDFKGRWRSELTPYCNEPMDCFNWPHVRKVILCWAPQTGKSNVGFNWLMYAADQDPGPAMYVMPDQFSCNRISNKRLIPSFRATPRLAAILSPRSDDVSAYYVKLLSMDLMMAWSGSPSTLSSEPARIMIFDEVDKYPPASGRETDPLALGEVRTLGYPFTKKLLYPSTPANEGDNMDRLLKEVADEIRDYLAVCQICHHPQIMTFDQFTWPSEITDPRVIERKHLAWYSCKSCGMKWDDAARDQAVRDPAAHWAPRIAVTEGKPTALAYHLPSWYSPFVRLAYVVAAHLRAKQGDPIKQRTFDTQHAAIPYVNVIQKKAESELIANRIDLAPLVCPAGTVGVTLFVDPGKDIFWFGAVAWKRDMSPHLVHYGYVTTWEEVRALVHDTTYALDRSPDVQLPVWRTGIDTGGGRAGDEETTMTEEAYDFIRMHGAGKIVGTKGKDAAYWTSGRKIRMNVIDRTPRKKPIPGGISLWTLNVNAFKDAVHYRLGLQEDHPGRLTFHAAAGQDLFMQIAAEEKKRDKYGRAVWTQTGKHNHYLDVLVGNFALADPEAAGGIAIRRPPSTTSPPPPPARAPGFVSKLLPGRGGFVKGYRR